LSTRSLASSFAAATSAITRLVARGQPPQLVFVPNRFNVHEIVAAYELAVALGCSAFVTGPMMRIGRAAAAWDQIACTDEDWQRAVDALRDRALNTDAPIALSIYRTSSPKWSADWKVRRPCSWWCPMAR
jgi:MoaA/NifB/PqqE/SkfB family radical SAM enzyme